MTKNGFVQLPVAIALAVLVALGASIGASFLGSEQKQAVDQSFEKFGEDVGKADEFSPQQKSILQKILDSPIKYLLAPFTVVHDPSRSTFFSGSKIYGIECSGPNYNIIVADPLQEEPPPPGSKVVSVTLAERDQLKVKVNGEVATCEWIEDFHAAGAAKAEICKTNIPVTREKNVEAFLEFTSFGSGSGLNGDCVYVEELEKMKDFSPSAERLPAPPVITEVPPSNTVFVASNIYAIECSGPNYSVVVADPPPGPPPSDPQTKLVFMTSAERNQFEIAVSGKKATCEWSEGFDVFEGNKAKVCRTNIPVTRERQIGAQLKYLPQAITKEFFGDCVYAE